MVPRFLPGLPALLLAVAAPAQAEPADLPGVGDLRWSMSSREVMAALPEGAERLEPPWDFGRMKAPARVPDTEIGGLRFTALLQVDAHTDRLLQVMLERREQNATPADFDRLRASLERDYGPPTRICETRRPTGDSESINLVWRFATTTVDLAFLDYRTTGILYKKPELTPDPLVPALQKRQVSRRSLPRRLVLRFHATAAAYLSPCLTRTDKAS